MNITIQKTTSSRPKPNMQSMGFGKHFSDHMFTMDAMNGEWGPAAIVPYGPLEIAPSSSVLHYGQEIFEGLKAYKTKDGRILLFRPEENFIRLAYSAERLGLPKLPVEAGIEATKALVSVDRDWVPDAPATMYIRPFMFGDDNYVGVSSAEHVRFLIITSPSGAYYSTGLEPVKIYVEDMYKRSCHGGMGYTKTGGNYAASLYPQELAARKGYEQVLWLDAAENKYVEEVGSMNIFFLFDDELVTPSLESKSILSGITRMSVIQLAESMGVRVSEREIEIQEVFDRAAKGELLECFGSGTAAVISPVGELKWKNETLIVNNEKIGTLTQKIYDQLTGIQFGELEDPFGWTMEVCRIEN